MSEFLNPSFLNCLIDTKTVIDNRNPKSSRSQILQFDRGRLLQTVDEFYRAMAILLTINMRCIYESSKDYPA